MPEAEQAAAQEREQVQALVAAQGRVPEPVLVLVVPRPEGRAAVQGRAPVAAVRITRTLEVRAIQVLRVTETRAFRRPFRGDATSAAADLNEPRKRARKPSVIASASEAIQTFSADVVRIATSLRFPKSMIGFLHPASVAEGVSRSSRHVRRGGGGR